LSLAKDYYSMKLDLLTNATVVDDAIRFVFDKTNDKEKPNPSVTKNDSEQDKEVSKESDYYEDEDQLEGEQEDEDGKIASSSTITMNQIF